MIISNINITATQALTWHDNNNTTCNIIKIFFIIHTLTDLLTHLLYYNNYIDSPYYCAYVARVTLLPACKYIQANNATIHLSIGTVCD